MAKSIVDAFDAMAGLSDDHACGQRLRQSVGAALSGDPTRRERALIDSYLGCESDLLHRSSDKYPEDIRRELLPHFQPFLVEHPDLGLIFASRESQTIMLATALLRAVAAESHGLIGSAAVDTMARKALADTPWASLKVSLKDGIEYSPMRLRTMQECVQLVSALFEGWLGLAGHVMGEAPVERAFERGYAQVAARYGWLPTLKNLLGALPVEVLALDKAKHLHDLETETTTQAQGLRAADEGLRRQAERLQQIVTELQATRLQLEAVSSAKSAFIDVVSHQFRTPLSSMRWSAETLYDALGRKEGVDPAHKEAIADIRAKSVYLIETLDRVFTSLEIDTGALMLDKKPAFLWEIVQDVHDQYEKDIKTKGLAWTFKRAKEQVVEIPLDKTKIQSVLKILIGNAIAYAKGNGAIVVDISNGKRNGNDYLVCTVTDDGLGVPSVDQKKFFEKFYRSKPAVLKVVNGTGLGNYIVKHLIEAHNGFVTVASEGENKGTTIQFGLPLA